VQVLREHLHHTLTLLQACVPAGGGGEKVAFCVVGVGCVDGFECRCCKQSESTN
jgi:hypothetical protein